MALAHSSGSFDYKVINENIRKILDVRSQLNNTVQVGMPFVKATTTIRGNNEYLNSSDNVGFTLGLHGIEEDVKYEDMYSSENGTDPLIGYTYTKNGTTQRVYAKNPNTELYKTAGQILDKQSALFTYPEKSTFVRIPPPGITNVTIGRNKNGLISMAQLQISIPSLIQLESLHRTFLIPGIGMILEWGQQFAPYPTNDTYLQKTDITQYMFPWHDRDKLNNLMTRLAKKDVPLVEILDKYVYPSNGQYMWMFGRVANFDIKSNSDGSFSSTVKIVGPSEDSWAYQVRNTVVPRKDSSSQLFCASDTNSVYSYFANTTAGGLNLKTLLDNVVKNKIPELSEWVDHVVYFKQGNQSVGEPEPNTDTATKDNKTFADHEDAYFMTWRFFVNVVINNNTHGIKKIFSNAGLSKELVDSIGLLMPYGNGASRDKSVGKLKSIDDPKECFVGANKYLRSTDPSVLVIVNEKAVELAAANPQYNIPVSEENLLNETAESRQFKKATSSFEVAAAEYHTDKNNPDRGFLSSGVWINHKALVKCMLKADTILRGITNLLDEMNLATEKYWQLTLDYIDGEPGKDPQTYTVVDANFKESSTIAVKNFIDKVHVFNKYIRSTKTGELVGSELIECGIDLSLPKRLFSQIATLGLISPSDMAKIQQKEVKVGDPVTEEEGDTAFSAKISDPNNTLAEMFGIISLSVKSGPNGSIDMTILSDAQGGNINSTCGKASTQMPGGVAGQGYQVADVNPAEATSNLPNERKKLLDSSNAAINSATCKQCAPCLSAIEEEKIKQLIDAPDAIQIQSATDSRFPNLDFSAPDSRRGAVSKELLIEVNQIFASENVIGVVSSGYRNPHSEGVSRHSRGIALDIYALYLNNDKSKLYSVGGYTGPSWTGDAKIAAGVFDKIYAKLLDAGYARAEGGNKRSVLWRTKDHYNHMHISLIPDTPPVPTPTTPVTTPTDNKSASEVCKSIYEKVGNGDAAKGEEECNRCARHTQIVDQVKKTTDTAVDTAVRKFAGFRKAFVYVEIFPEMMVASITANADGDRSNAFGASPGSLSIGGDIVLPGINGLRVGELFWIDRVPAFYKVFGAFQVLSIEDTIGSDGWKTKIHARFNYLGTAWKRSMVEILV